MPKYALVRDLDPSMTRAEFDGAALTVIASEKSYVYRGTDVPQQGDHGIHWIRTLWQQGGTWGLCLYEAPDIDSLTDFEEACGMPFVEAYEVQELVDPAADHDPAELDGDRVAVSLTLDGESNPEAAVLAVAPDTPERTPTDAKWIRTYWDPQSSRATALFRVPAGKSSSLSPDSPNIDRVANVVVVDPNEYR